VAGGELQRPNSAQADAGPLTAALGQHTSGAQRVGPNARRKLSLGLALIGPALVTLGLTLLYPIGWTVWLSLNSNRTALQGTPDFVGLANYIRIALNPDFETALTQTLGLTEVSFVLEALIGLAVALALDRGLRGAELFRAIVALPLMVAPVVGALAWRFMFATGYGLIDSMAHLFGASGPLWFSNVWLARATIVITNLWLALPFDILVLLAGLTNLPQEPQEAARVDGASPLQIFTWVTLPLLRPVIAVILVIRIADAFRIFDVVYVLTGGGPANKTDVLSTFVYRQMFSVFDFAGGAAAAILLVIVTSLASLAVVAVTREDWREA
jgi:multiple sugar transport system permease protein